jgi:hypothetical protein
MTISIMSVSTDPGELFCAKRVIIARGGAVMIRDHFRVLTIDLCDG